MLLVLGAEWPMEHHWNHLHSGAANADWEQPPSHPANGQPNPSPAIESQHPIACDRQPID
ncbi:MAG: hypothetical protein ACAF42_13465 [Limnothrix sp. BL-A-16]